MRRPSTGAVAVTVAIILSFAFFGWRDQQYREGAVDRSEEIATLTAQLESLTTSYEQLRSAAAEVGVEAPPSGDVADPSTPNPPVVVQHGTDGLPGPRGQQGRPGVNGRDGDPGPPGEPGADGVDGEGTTGPQGPQGPTGPAGAVGPEGPAGPAGPAGAPGAAGATGPAPAVIVIPDGQGGYCEARDVDLDGRYSCDEVPAGRR